MSDGLVFIGKELELVAVRQIDHAQHLAENQFADVDVDVARNVSGQALDFDLAQHLLEDAALRLHAGRLADQFDGHLDRQFLVHGDALHVDVQQLALDGLVLPVDDHGLGF